MGFKPYTMNLLLDAHTHTIASGHAYSTLSELVTAAKEKNLKLLAITEHGPNMNGSCNHLYFSNLRVIPRQQGSLTLLLGAEANIIDFNGTLDFSDSLISCLDFVIASLHIPCIKPGTKDENTNAYIQAMQNPRVAVIGHPDDARYPIDYETLVIAAKKYNVLLEINNSSLSPLSFRSNSLENTIELLSLCKKYQTPVILNSDAHIASDVGNFSYILPILEKLEFPESLVVNTSLSLFEEYVKEKSAKIS